MTTEQEQRPVIQADAIDLELELCRLYNFADDDSVQFTRHNMLAAIRHGMRLAQQPRATEAEPVVWRPGVGQAVLAFDGGILLIRRDGSAELSFDDAELDYYQEPEDATDYRVCKLVASEVVAIRDALNKWTGYSLAHPQAQPSGDVVERYLSDRFQWAAPGDQQEDVWLLRFCDTDIRDAMWQGPHAEKEAWDAWNRHAPGYNCYLFRLAALAHQRPDEPGEVERLRKWLKHDGLCGIVGGYGYCTCGLDAALSTPTVQEGE